MKIQNKLFLLLCVLAFNTSGAQEIEKWKLEDLQLAMATADRPTVFNFWATFCKPCLEEIPYFQEIVKKYDSAGVRLVLVSLDMADAYPKKIISVAARRNITAPIFFLDETNADLFCPAVDESWSGAIPATLFINNATGFRRFFEEQVKKATFEKELRLMLGY